MTLEQIQKIRVGSISIPNYMHDAILGYFNDHLPPGGFLQAVLKNDFMEACGCADGANFTALQAYASFLYMEAPDGSFGSPEKVKAWLEQREDKDGSR